MILCFPRPMRDKAQIIMPFTITDKCTPKRDRRPCYRAPYLFFITQSLRILSRSKQRRSRTTIINHQLLSVEQYFPFLVYREDSRVCAVIVAVNIFNDEAVLIVARGKKVIDHIVTVLPGVGIIEVILYILAALFIIDAADRVYPVSRYQPYRFAPPRRAPSRSR